MTTKERLAVEMEERERCLRIVQRHINFWSRGEKSREKTLLLNECENIRIEIKG